MDENTGAQPFRVGPFGPWDLLEKQRLTDYVLSELIKATDQLEIILALGRAGMDMRAAMQFIAHVERIHSRLNRKAGWRTYEIGWVALVLTLGVAVAQGYWLMPEIVDLFLLGGLLLGISFWGGGAFRVLENADSKGRGFLYGLAFLAGLGALVGGIGLLNILDVL